MKRRNREQEALDKMRDADLRLNGALNEAAAARIARNEAVKAYDVVHAKSLKALLGEKSRPRGRK